MCDVARLGNWMNGIPGVPKSAPIGMGLLEEV